MNNVHLLADASGTAGSTADFTVTMGVQNQGEAYTSNQDTISSDTATGGIIQLWSEVFGDTFDFSLTQGATTFPLVIHTIGFDVTGYEENTG